MSSMTHHGPHHVGRTLTEAGSSTLAAFILATALALPCVLIAWLSLALGMRGLDHSVVMKLTEATAGVLIIGLASGIALLAGGRALRDH